MGTPEIRDFNIVENRCIARDTYELVLAGDTAGLEVPGRFVNIALAGCYLRRPLSVCQAEDQLLTLIYKVVGKGTGILSRMEAGARLDLLCPLGNGFDASAAGPGDRIVLVGGGAGLPPPLRPVQGPPAGRPETLDRDGLRNTGGGLL